VHGVGQNEVCLYGWFFVEKFVVSARISGFGRREPEIVEREVNKRGRTVADWNARFPFQDFSSQGPWTVLMCAC
jgi:hypothetical protein